MLLPVVCKQLRRTCCSNITVPAVGAFEVDETQRGCSQLDKAQVHEQGWGGDGECLPLGKRSAYKVCQNSTKEQHLQHALKVWYRTSPLKPKHVGSSKQRCRNSVSDCKNRQDLEPCKHSHFAINDMKTSKQAMQSVCCRSKFNDIFATSGCTCSYMCVALHSNLSIHMPCTASQQHEVEASKAAFSQLTCRAIQLESRIMLVRRCLQCRTKPIMPCFIATLGLSLYISAADLQGL